MDDDGEFLDWFHTTWKDAEDAIHNGDPTPRFATWSEREPVTLFGAGWNARNREEAHAVFRHIAGEFGDIGSCDIDLVSHEVLGDFAYTVHREHTKTSVRGEPRDYTLRVTQVYRREDGAWKVVHRHGDNEVALVAP